MEASRWDRIDDISRRLDRYERRLRELEGDVELLVRMDERLKHVEQSQDSCLASINAIKDAIAERDKQAAKEYKQQHQDHRKQRNWFIGVIVAACGVAVAASAFIYSVIEKAPT